MIENIRQILNDGCELEIKNGKGKRKLTFSAGTVLDPLNEITSYNLDKTADRKITLRFYSGNKGAGYVQYSRMGRWSGRSQGSFVELTAVVPHVWAKLNEYAPKTKTEKVYKEMLVEGVDFKKHTEEWKFDKKNPTALVIFSYNRPQLLRELFSSLPADLDMDLIIIQDRYERDSHAVEIRGIIENSAFTSKQIFVRPIHFGLGRNVLDGMRQVFETYERAVFLTDDVEVTDETPQYISNMLEYAGTQSNVYAVQAWTTHNQITKDGNAKLRVNYDRLLSFGMTKKRWEDIKEDVLKYMNSFMVTKYENRPIRSMIDWLSGFYSKNFIMPADGIAPSIADMRKRKALLTKSNVDPFFAIQVIADKHGMVKLAPNWSRVTYKGKAGTNDRPQSFLDEGYEKIQKRANKRDKNIRNFSLEVNDE